jgi:VanZ family protein
VSDTATAYLPLPHLHWWLRVGRLGLAAVVVLSLVPSPEIAVSVEGLDKLEHGLVWLAATTWYAQLLASRRRLALYAIGFLALGCAIELAQGLTPWRSADWRDLVADAIGVGLGYALAFTPVRRVLSRVDRSRSGQVP